MTLYIFIRTLIKLKRPGIGDKFKKKIYKE
jgi:hypothetical protein